MSERERVLAEMLNKICVYYSGGWCTSQDGKCDQKCGFGIKAQTLYDMGYRKIDGTHYVSMEWHEEQVQHAQDEIEKLKLQLQHAEENEEVLTKNAEEIAKQAVRDFAEKVKTKSIPTTLPSGERVVFTSQIDKVLEEYDK